MGDEDELRARIEAQVASRRPQTDPSGPRHAAAASAVPAIDPDETCIDEDDNTRSGLFHRARDWVLAPADGPAGGQTEAEAEHAAGPNAPKRRRRTMRALSRILVVIAIAAVAAVLLRTYVAAPYYIPSVSMEPTLHGCKGCNNDHVLVGKLSYN